MQTVFPRGRAEPKTCCIAFVDILDFSGGAGILCLKNARQTTTSSRDYFRSTLACTQDLCMARLECDGASATLYRPRREIVRIRFT